jgi:hypothetical protein
MIYARLDTELRRNDRIGSRARIVIGLQSEPVEVWKLTLGSTLHKSPDERAERVYSNEVHIL